MVKEQNYDELSPGPSSPSPLQEPFWQEPSSRVPWPLELHRPSSWVAEELRPNPALRNLRQGRRRP